jgi:hypothetical protein
MKHYLKLFYKGSYMNPIVEYVLFCALLGSLTGICTYIEKLRKSLECESAKLQTLLVEIRDKPGK